MRKRFRLADYAITFSTRTKADEVTDMLSKYVKTMAADDDLIIDFSKVQAISYSFLDQFIGRISSLTSLKNKSISIAGWSADLVSVIDKSLQHRNCDYSHSKAANERILVCQPN